MEKVRIKDKSNGAIIEVAKALASDYIMTGNFEYVKEPIKNLNSSNDRSTSQYK